MKTPREIARSLAANHHCEPMDMCGHAEDIEAALAEARKVALGEACGLVCTNCRVGLPLGSYYDREDAWRPEPDWSDDAVAHVNHGYDSYGDINPCWAEEIRRALAKEG